MKERDETVGNFGFGKTGFGKMGVGYTEVEKELAGKV